MKQIFLIAIMLIITFQAKAQRDTLDYSTVIINDTMSIEKVDTDSTYNFFYRLNGLDYKTTFKTNVENIMRDSLDSLLNVISIYQAQARLYVEEYYKLYQQTNSKLWNLTKQYARLEEAYNDLYNP